MQSGTVQKLIDIFNRSCQRLDTHVSLEKLEELAVTIHRGMTAQARNFHTLEHVFSFIDPEDPIRTLAALYHDIIYYQVDMGFSPHLWKIISPYVQQRASEFFLCKPIAAADEIAHLTLEVFDLNPGQHLSSFTALNEFLSALVMNKQLEGIVSKKDLLLMTICVEATIPFRAVSHGQSHFAIMETRLSEIAARHAIALSPEEITDTIRKAVLFANKDIENFAEIDPGRFLDNTWKLLPETNPALRLPDVYSIGTYRQALQKMADFFENLDPDSVFNQYRGVPSDQEFSLMLASARSNLRIAREYLKIKILAMTILEALAVATGGDAPVSLFMGDVPREGVSIKRLEYFLPELEPPAWVDENSTLYRLLESGRASETSFDMKNSPLSLFIYKSLTPQEVEQALLHAQEMYTQKVNAHEFLTGISHAVVASIASASALMVFTRRQALSKYAEY
ncbi:MAG: hypothetical protein CO094_00695 [Anaerolineae bacterium CG_4_9_14_3_um_filter_57_17]|nr:hypothetical protein [bacterium]NCT21194.1 hypothetical protein [bacterium]OIO84228.1 MAG: hypothetical protein AUK01_10005 [Anaerolineae bacterium CG2_30_57_67]PJB68572.1 MAG: hypothetical protein CO094_00695 [Anaerolineae bacterium CG_4_9_14_3_um_filter_57_17]